MNPQNQEQKEVEEILKWETGVDCEEKVYVIMEVDENYEDRTEANKAIKKEIDENELIKSATKEELIEIIKNQAGALYGFNRLFLENRFKNYQEYLEHFCKILEDSIKISDEKDLKMGNDNINKNHENKKENRKLVSGYFDETYVAVEIENNKSATCYTEDGHILKLPYCPETKTFSTFMGKKLVLEGTEEYNEILIKTEREKFNKTLKEIDEMVDKKIEWYDIRYHQESLIDLLKEFAKEYYKLKNFYFEELFSVDDLSKKIDEMQNEIECRYSD